MERNKLLNASNELKIELNRLKDKQSIKNNDIRQTLREKLEKLKKDYQNLSPSNE